jgi:hypothetical protein
MGSRSEIVQTNPINHGLDIFRASCDGADFDADSQKSTKNLKTALIDFLTAFQSLPTARRLPSTTGRGTLRSDLLRLELSIEFDEFDLEQLIPLFKAVLENEPEEGIWNKVYDAVTEFTPSPRLISSIQQTS